MACRIGFNSVYHITDIPSFVTGSQLVLFDPHTDILGVSVSNPGMRSDFVKSQLLRTMPDQCKPLPGLRLQYEAGFCWDPIQIAPKKRCSSFT